MSCFFRKGLLILRAATLRDFLCYCSWRLASMVLTGIVWAWLRVISFCLLLYVVVSGFTIVFTLTVTILVGAAIMMMVWSMTFWSFTIRVQALHSSLFLKWHLKLRISPLWHQVWLLQCLRSLVWVGLSILFGWNTV